MFKYSDLKDDIKTALHITKPDRFSKTNSTVASELGDDRTANATYVFNDLLARDLNVLINVGNMDMKDGVRQSMEWTKNINWPQKDDFFS
jgi:hypothetical protein